MDKPLLPPGVRGYSFDSFALLFARDKVVVSPRGSCKHYTIHFGPASGYMDVHETIESDGRDKVHTTLFRISHASLRRLVEELAPVTERTLGAVVRPLRLGWLARRGIVAVTGLHPSTEQLLEVSQVRRGKLTVDQAKLAARASIPPYLEILYALPDGEPFTLLAQRRSGKFRQVGVGFKTTDAQGRPKLKWIPIHKVAHALTALGGRLIEAAREHGELSESGINAITT